MSFFIAACGSSSDAGIYTGDVLEGKYVQRAFLPYPFASYLISSQDGRYVYAAIESKPAGGVAAFRVMEGQALEPVNSWSADGQSTCHVALSPDERFLFAANYGKGRLLQFSVDNGKILGDPLVIQHEGKGVHPTRQEGPHVHYVIVTPDQKYLCTVDLGLDEISAYPITAQGLDVAAVRVSRITPAGSGPRHFIFGQGGHVAYLVNELGNTVMVLDYADGYFKIRQTLPMLPAALNVYSKASAIRFSADGRYLLASNRGYDTIVSYRVLPDGSLKQAFFGFIGGQGPRDFQFLPGGKKIFVGCEISNNAFLLDFDGRDGSFMPDGNVIPSMPRPISILAIP